MIDGSGGYERFVVLEGGSNFRDVGGYRSADGRSVRWRHLLRSGAFGQVTERDIASLRAMGIRAVLDLRCTEERELVLARWLPEIVHAHDYSSDLLFGRMTTPGEGQGIGGQSGQLYAIFPDMLRPHLISLFGALREGGTPIVINCSAGQDRTGFAVALVLAALGVSREQIVEDYLHSTSRRLRENELDITRVRELAGRNAVADFYANVIDERGEQALAPRPLLDEAGRAKILLAFDAIEARWGSVENYLEAEFELDAAGLARLRDDYLE